MPVLKSSRIAREVGIPYTRLFSLIRAGKLTPPPKDDSGDYLWASDDIERIRQALRIDRRRKAVSA